MAFGGTTVHQSRYSATAASLFDVEPRAASGERQHGSEAPDPHESSDHKWRLRREGRPGWEVLEEGTAWCVRGSEGCLRASLNGAILYVGNTTIGDYGTFGERLRRQFQETAAGKSKLHQLLCEQTDVIRTYCLDLQDLDMMVDAASMSLARERKALIMEQVLIGIYDPPGNDR